MVAGQHGRVAARRHERGAAIFVVILVLTMLTGIGVFAMRAASLAEAASGYDRQNTQNHYVGEFGLRGAVAELSSERRNYYYAKLLKGEEKCIGNQGLVSTNGMIPCAPIESRDVQTAVTSTFSGRPLFEPATASSSTVTPGSLGPAGLEGYFRVELTDPGPAGSPVAGSLVSGPQGTKWVYKQLTLTSVGQVRPTTANPEVCVVTSAGVAGNETGRAFVVFGPVLE